MNKIIWFINKDCAPIEEYGTHLRTVKQAQYFQAKGYDVKVVCSARVHNSEINHVEQGDYKEEVRDGVPFLFVKTLSYKSNGPKRVLAYIQFAWTVFCLRDKLQKPDIVVHTSRIPFDYFVYKFVKRVKAKYIIDVTDLWPMEIEHFGFLRKDGIILKWFYNIERKLYTKADHLVFSMEGYPEYLKEKKWDKENGGKIDLAKTHYVNNGIDLQEFDHNLSEYKIEDADLVDESTFKVVYLGSIRKANNLESLIDAANELKDYSDIKILVFGDGNERPALEQRVKDEHIDNVVFKRKWTEIQYVPYVLSKANINLLNYGPDSGRYGGSMNKMMMSFASGKPIVCNIGMRYSPIRDNKLGIDEFFSTSKEYAEAILSIYRLSKEDYEAMSQRTRETAKEFDIPVLCKKFEEYCGL